MLSSGEYLCGGIPAETHVVQVGQTYGKPVLKLKLSLFS